MGTPVVLPASSSRCRRMSRGNLTITVARKPTVGTVVSNALTWGTGAINIDACRIGTSDKVTLHPNSTVRERGVRRMYDGGDIAPITEEHQTAGQALGRWPANLILVHNAGCLKSGTKRVAATSAGGHRTAVRRSGVHSEAGGHQRIGTLQPVTGFGDEDGLETVDAWECEPTCPCRLLDEPSGVLVSGTGAAQRH